MLNRPNTEFHPLKYCLLIQNNKQFEIEDNVNKTNNWRDIIKIRNIENMLNDITFFHL